MNQRYSSWIDDLTFDEEFAIFDRSDGIVLAVDRSHMDNRQVADEDGNLYGYEVLSDGSLREIGTWYQQLAEFPAQREGAPWHGYPIYPNSSEEAPQQFRGQRCRPSTKVFDRMVEIGDITPTQRKMLKRGDRVV